LEILQAQLEESRLSNSNLKTELATALAANATASSNVKVEVPQDLMQLEKLQRVEAECEQLREKLREMTSAEEKLKLEA
jgi:hypothetical protein